MARAPLRNGSFTTRVIWGVRWPPVGSADTDFGRIARPRRLQLERAVFRSDPAGSSRRLARDLEMGVGYT